MNIATAQRGTVKLAALVRDKHGNPKFDDPDNVPDAIKQLLTEDELEALENGTYSRNSNAQ